MENNEHIEPEIGVVNSEKKGIFPTYLELFAIFGVVVLTQICVMIVANIATKYMEPISNQEAMLGWMTLLSHSLSMVVAIIMVLLLRRKHGGRAVAPIRFSWRGFDPLSILFGFIMLLSTNIILEPLVEILPSPTQDVPTHWTTLLTVVLCAPILEEILCRGLLYESLRERGGVLRAMLISSLFFGVLHLYPASIVVAFVAGLILCFFYIYSRSIIAPMILHALNNAMAYLFIVLKWDEITVREVITNDTLYYSIYILSLIVIILSAIFCRSRLKSIIKTQSQSSADATEVVVEPIETSDTE